MATLKRSVVDGPALDHFHHVTCKPIFEWAFEHQFRPEIENRLSIIESALAEYYGTGEGHKNTIAPISFSKGEPLREQPVVLVCMSLNDYDEEEYTATVVFKQDNNGTTYSFEYEYMPRV